MSPNMLKALQQLRREERNMDAKARAVHDLQPVFTNALAWWAQMDRTRHAFYVTGRTNYYGSL